MDRRYLLIRRTSYHVSSPLHCIVYHQGTAGLTFWSKPKNKKISENLSLVYSRDKTAVHALLFSFSTLVYFVAEKTFVVLFFSCITPNNSQARWLPTLKWVAKWFSNNWHQWHNSRYTAPLLWKGDSEYYLDKMTGVMFILTRYRRRGTAILEIFVISST